MTTRSDRPTCLDVVWKIGPLLDGELPASEQEPVEAHLHSCADCAAAAQSFASLDRLAAREQVPPVSEEEWTGVWGRILARRDAPEAALSALSGPLRSPACVSPVRVWTLRAAAAAAIFALGILAGRRGPRDEPEAGRIAPAPVASMEPGAAGAAKPDEELAEKPEVREDGDVSFIQYKNF